MLFAKEKLSSRRGSGKKSFFVPQSCMFLEGVFLSLDGPGQRPRVLRWSHSQAFVPALLLSLQGTPPLPGCLGLPQLSGPSTH